MKSLLSLESLCHTPCSLITVEYHILEIKNPPHIYVTLSIETSWCFWKDKIMDQAITELQLSMSLSIQTVDLKKKQIENRNAFRVVESNPTFWHTHYICTILFCYLHPELPPTIMVMWRQFKIFCFSFQNQILIKIL